jgi:hypothetical protein
MLLHGGNNMDQRGTLRPYQLVLAEFEVTYNFNHEWAVIGRPVVPSGARRGKIEVAAQPYGAFGANGYMLGNVVPAIGLGMVAPHTLYRGMPAVLSVVRPPGMMHVHRINAPREVELCQKFREFVIVKL